MKLVLQIKLLPDDAQAKALHGTIEKANASCNRISEIAWKEKTFNQFKLHQKSYYLVKECDLMIVIGSSCVVRPAATLVGEINDKAKLVIINNMKTPYDHKADLIISDKSCGEVLEEVANGL